VKDTFDLLTKPISQAAFAPYGCVVQVGSSGLLVNDGTARRYDIDSFSGKQADPALALTTSIFQVDAVTLPRTIRILERHSRTAQLIVPVSASEHVVVVCLSGSHSTPDLQTLGAFRLTGEQGVIYRPGVWHHPIMALDRNALFLVQSWQDGTDRDCEVIAIDPLRITGASSMP
jgi:ureidoglycolate lyase